MKIEKLEQAAKLNEQRNKLLPLLSDLEKAGFVEVVMFVNGKNQHILETTGPALPREYVKTKLEHVDRELIGLGVEL